MSFLAASFLLLLLLCTDTSAQANISACEAPTESCTSTADCCVAPTPSVCDHSVLFGECFACPALGVPCTESSQCCDTVPDASLRSYCDRSSATCASCASAGEHCAGDAGCCGAPGLVCLSGLCVSTLGPTAAPIYNTPSPTALPTGAPTAVPTGELAVRRAPHSDDFSAQACLPIAAGCSAEPSSCCTTPELLWCCPIPICQVGGEAATCELCAFEGSSCSTPISGGCCQPPATCVNNGTGQFCIAPTEAPTTAPTPFPTGQPTAQPTGQPTGQPTSQPTGQPTTAPTKAPTSAPTNAPTSAPTNAPTTAPTKAPTSAPTKAPTQAPTPSPTGAPTVEPPIGQDDPTVLMAVMLTLTLVLGALMLVCFLIAMRRRTYRRDSE